MRDLIFVGYLLALMFIAFKRPFLFTLVYVALFVVFIALLDQKIRKGPLAEDLVASGEAR